MKRYDRIGVVCLIVLAAATGVEANENEFLDLSLEALMDVSVTSVAGFEQDWFRTPAAMYVLKAEDLERAGVLYLPDAFRMVPGMHVQQGDARQWAVGARGGTDLFASRLLVMMDGRTIYDPSFSGVFWDVQTPILHDLERIEIVRGPGATLWGTNAVNGVINVTSKSAEDTQGLYASVVTGDIEHAIVETRYGGQFSDSTYYRVWGRYTERDNFPAQVSSDPTPDDYNLFKGGFRLDTDDADGGSLRFELGGHHSDRLGGSTPVPVPPAGQVTDVRDDRADLIYAILDLEHTDDGGHISSLQGYLEYDERDLMAGVSMERLTLDLDFRQHRTINQTLGLVWGAGLRYHHMDTQQGRRGGFMNPDRDLTTLTAFAQGNWQIVPDKLDFTVGSKIEHNDFTGFEYQPSARLNWAVDKNQNLWGSVSRAVRTPSLTDDDVSLVAAYMFGIPFSAKGNPDLDAEVLYAYELGYRWRTDDDRLWIDVAAFWHHYEDMILFVESALSIQNVDDGRTSGLEWAANWQVEDNVRLVGTYTYLHADTATQDFNVSQGRHAASLRALVDITDWLEFNTAAYYASENGRRKPVGEHLRLDVGLTWHVNDRLDLSVWGQNLLDGSNFEQGDDFFKSADQEVPRAFYIRATLNW